MLAAATVGTAEDDDELGGLPAAVDREEIFYLCFACHSIRLMTQQGLSRAAWEETPVWRVDEQEMEPLEPAERQLVLDYLATHFNTDHRPALRLRIR